MATEWTKYQRGDRVKLNFGYHGFPATEGRVLKCWPAVIELLFDGEDHYRVLPYSMIQHASNDQSTNDSREVQGDSSSPSLLQTVLASEQQPCAWMPGL